MDRKYGNIAYLKPEPIDALTLVLVKIVSPVLLLTRTSEKTFIESSPKMYKKLLAAIIAAMSVLSVESVSVMNPDLVATPRYAAMTAGWFWNTHKLNQYADSQDYKTLTKKINGGFIGLEDRIKHIDHALLVLAS